MAEIAFRVGDRVRLPNGATGTVARAGETPVDEIGVRLDGSNMIASVDPMSTRIELVHANGKATNEIKEDDSMQTSSGKAVEPVTIPENVGESRLLPEISPEEILFSSKQYLMPLPSGARVKVSFRKLTPSMGKLVVEDELGSRTFTVFASKREAGDIYIPGAVKETYKKQNGETGESVVLEAHGQANAILVAIARRVMQVERISLGSDEELEELAGPIPF